jgi:hypothetical protein
MHGTRSHLYSFFLILLVFSAAHTYAQQTPVATYLPTHQEVLQSYINADKLDSAWKKLAINYNIKPNWQPNNKQFWYGKRVKNNETDYYFVDAEKGLKRKVFDSKQMADAVSTVLGIPLPVNKLHITKMFFSADEKQVTLKINDSWLKCDLSNYHCEKTTDTLFKSYDPDEPLQTRRYRWEGLVTDSVSPYKSIDTP